MCTSERWSRLLRNIETWKEKKNCETEEGNSKLPLAGSVYTQEILPISYPQGRCGGYAYLWSIHSIFSVCPGVVDATLRFAHLPQAYTYGPRRNCFSSSMDAFNCKLTKNIACLLALTLRGVRLHKAQATWRRTAAKCWKLHHLVKTKLKHVAA